MSYYLKMPLLYSRDGDAIKFVRAAGLTDPTHIEALHYLVNELKNNNLWTKINTLYPFVGGTATTHKYNLKDPRDLDAAFRITFAGGITHNSDGVTFDGINGFGNTHLIPSNNFALDSECLFAYSRTSAAAAVNAIDMGAANTIKQRDQLQIRTSTNNMITSINSTSSGGNISTTNTDGQGFYTSSRTSSTDLRHFKNGSQLGSTNVTANNGARSGLKLYIGARNLSNAGNGFVNRNFALMGTSSGLTSTEVSTLYTIVQQYQTRLGRQI